MRPQNDRRETGRVKSALCNNRNEAGIADELGPTMDKPEAEITKRGPSRKRGVSRKCSFYTAGTFTPYRRYGNLGTMTLNRDTPNISHTKLAMTHPTSGRGAMQGLMDGTVPPPPMVLLTNLRLVEFEAGRAVFEARPDERHLNIAGIVHGGYVATVLDTVTGFSIQSAIDTDVGFTTIDLTVKMLRPMKAGELYRAEGRVLNVSKRLGVAEGKIHDAAGKLVAHATCTGMILGGRA